MKNIKKITIFANITKPRVYKIANEIRKYLENKKYTVSICKLTSDTDDYMLNVEETDLAVSLGGDGTVLTCASLLEKMHTPIIAINLGTFGYITQTNIREIKRVFEDFVNGKSTTQKRTRLEVSVMRNGKKIFRTSALNDITVSSTSRAKIAKLTLYIDDVLAANIKADGIIISTPTGSTAYNLSAGGPIIDSGIRAMIINAICPFSMDFRPLVVKDSSKVSLVIPKQASIICVTSDGHTVFDLEKDDEVIISKSLHYTYFVENKNRSPIELLRDKLGWAGGFND